MKNIAIISYGGLPMPPVMGGAVENLTHFWIEENETDKRVKLTVFSSYHTDAQLEAEKYANTTFIYVKTRKIFDFVTKWTNRIFRRLKLPLMFQCYPYVVEITKQLKKGEYNCIIVENRPEFVPYLRKNMSIPIILHMHNDYFNSNFFGARKILEGCEKVIAVSEYVKNCILTIDKNAKNVCILQNVINTKQFSNVTSITREKLRKQYGIKEGDVVFGYVGRIIPGKGVKELVQAFVQINQKFDHVKLLVIGSGWFGQNNKTGYIEELRRMTEGLNEKVIFSGYVDYHSIAEQYACADVVVVPSIMGEACGLVALEAMASGKALIVSDSGGIWEHVNSECAIRVMRCDGFVDRLAIAMETLAINKDQIYRMGQKGSEHSAQYDNKMYLQKLLEIVDGVCEN